MFTYLHLVQFYETDMMGVVHHSNYLRFFEEARVAWAHEHGLIDYQRPESASRFAVYETLVRHLKPAFFGDTLHTEVQARREGIKVQFQYRMWSVSRAADAIKTLVSVAQTVHVPLDENLKIKRLSPEMLQVLERQSWTETWL
ncbi:MAG: acyl-CoA thioesterase [Pseudobdellovibrionaceae bacterium]